MRTTHEQKRRPPISPLIKKACGPEAIKGQTKGTRGTGRSRKTPIRGGRKVLP